VTYSRARFDEASMAWERGRYSDEWEPWRVLAARGPGIIWPPQGTSLDSWDDTHPTQRALLIRAIRETPDLLRWAIRGATAPSWHAVIARLLAGRDEMRELLDLEDVPVHPDLPPRDSMRRLGELLTIAKDSTT
jgi:hypothetical protein